MGVAHVYTPPGVLTNIFHFETFNGSKVLAGHAGDITVKSHEPHLTVTGPGGCCLRAGAAVVTAHLAAQVHIVLAVLSIVSHRAGAAVGAQAISAGASILTGLRVALVLLVLTVRPVKTRAATAGKGVDVINASPVIQT